jgi:hypothetical protein
MSRSDDQRIADILDACGELASMHEYHGLAAGAIVGACLGPGHPIPPRAMYLLEEIFQQQSDAATPRATRGVPTDN